MITYSTEVTSSKIISDKPLFARTLKAYLISNSIIKGKTLEIGCGEGYGIKHYINKTTSLSVLDKSKVNLKNIKNAFPEVTIHKQRIPPINNLKENSFDTIISFQVIEHIKKSDVFLKEIYRLLKPNGTAIITTPNRKKTSIRNPWHFKEFDYDELNLLLKNTFKNYEISGIEGNKQTDLYYQKSVKSALRIIKLDIFNLHKHAPSFILKIPYNIFNRLNRKTLLKRNSEIVKNITDKDYLLKEYNENTLDFYCILKK